MFIEAKDDGGGGDNWTTGAISRAGTDSLTRITKRQNTQITKNDTT